MLDCPTTRCRVAHRLIGLIHARPHVPAAGEDHHPEDDDDRHLVPGLGAGPPAGAIEPAID